MTQRSLFDVMGLEARYHLSQADLERRYLALSKELHPDRHARSMPRERTLAVVRTTELNDAYRVLRDDTKRAEYLLKLKGIDVGAEGPRTLHRDEPTHKVDPGLLVEALELREDLAEARAGGDDARVQELAGQVRTRRQAALEAIDQGFRALDAGEASRLRTIADALVALRYHDRFLEEVEAHEESKES